MGFVGFNRSHLWCGKGQGMTAFIAAYDTERPGDCRKACGAITRIHRKRRIPATFFIMGELLEDEGAAYKQLLNEPGLFEVASHTYSHGMLRDHPICGPAVGPEEIHGEIFRGKEIVEEVFERECLGLRPGCSFDVGLSGARHIVAEVVTAGFRYVSSRAWGPHCTVPAPLEQAYTYAEEGHPDLWEFPCHGWHENLLKGANSTPGRLLLWPPIYPELHPPGYVRTAQEEFDVHRFFIDRALKDALEYVTLIWHPWSLGRFDPEMRMLELVFDYVAGLGMPFMRFEDLWRKRAAG